MFPEVIVLLCYLDFKHSHVLKKIRNYEFTMQELISQLDVILIKKYNPLNIRLIRFLLASFICRYESGYLEKLSGEAERLVDRSDVNDLKLKIKSKFEDDNKSLYRAVEYFKDQRTNRVKLDYILGKFDLAENLKS